MDVGASWFRVGNLDGRYSGRGTDPMTARWPGATMKDPARITVRHNGVVVHDAVALLGPTSHRRRDPYVMHADELPISLQDHGHPVRFRNIWVRPLAP